MRYVRRGKNGFRKTWEKLALKNGAVDSLEHKENLDLET